jgi:hypothetical protein
LSLISASQLEDSELACIDRTICHGAHPDGTAIRFESFTVWKLDR